MASHNTDFRYEVGIEFPDGTGSMEDAYPNSGAAFDHASFRAGYLANKGEDVKVYVFDRMAHKGKPQLWYVDVVVGGFTCASYRPRDKQPNCAECGKGYGLVRTANGVWICPDHANETTQHETNKKPCFNCGQKAIAEVFDGYWFCADCVDDIETDLAYAQQDNDEQKRNGWMS